MEHKYKVGDIVVVTERYDTNDAKVGSIVKLDKIEDWSSIPYCGTNRYEGIKKSWCKNVRLATIEEIEQYVKENKLSIEEILEICQNLYPKGTEYIGVFNGRQGKVSDLLQINSTRKGIYEPMVDYLYDEGKFARIVNQEEELPFKVGDKFYYINHPEKHWTITDIKDDKVYCGGESYSSRTIQDVVRYLTIDKIWLPYKPSFKKEDFYNTKIDVSKSEELSKAVQEKLFELGFKWAGGQTHYLKHDRKYITIEKSRFRVSDQSQSREIYPEDLGININNKKQTNNVNKENSIKVQGFNQQISEPSGTRGIGLKSSRGKITLGIINSPNKAGLSKR